MSTVLFYLQNVVGTSFSQQAAKRKCKKIIGEWAASHFYPNKEENQELAGQMGQSLQQIYKKLRNARNRIKKRRFE